MSILADLSLESGGRTPSIKLSQSECSWLEVVSDHKRLVRAFAKLRCGAVVISSSNPATSVLAALAALEAGVSVIVSTPGTRRRATKALDAIGLQPRDHRPVQTVAGSAAIQTLDSLAWAHAGGRERELVFSTSGTTSIPKLVPFSVEQVDFILTAIQQRLRYGADDLVASPFNSAFDYGFYQVLLCFRVGATASWFDGLRFARDAALSILRDAASIAPITPGYAVRLLEACNADGMTLPSVRLVTSTGAHLSSDLMKQLKTVMPNATILPMYGLTECKRVSISDPTTAELFPESVGTPLSGSHVVIVDETGREVASGTQGEAVVSGPHIARGYVGGEPWGGLLFTGDLMSQDDSSRLYHHGRVRSDIIKIDDERLSLFEISDVAEPFAGGKLIQVAIGGPDGNQIVVRFESSSVDLTELRKRMMSEFGLKVSRRLVINQGERLQINSSGKITKDE